MTDDLMTPEIRAERYNRQRNTLIGYLRHKTDICDWHGVSDAANDLRVLEAAYNAWVDTYSVST